LSKLGTYFSINKPEASAGLVFSQTFLDEILNNLLGNPDASTSCAHEYSTVIPDRSSSALQGVDNTSQYDSSSSLNIVIEAGVLMLVLLKCREGILEVLKLNDNTSLY
jgi:hypothetical protein